MLFYIFRGVASQHRVLFFSRIEEVKQINSYKKSYKEQFEANGKLKTKSCIDKPMHYINVYFFKMRFNVF